MFRLIQTFPAKLMMVLVLVSMAVLAGACMAPAPPAGPVPAKRSAYTGIQHSADPTQSSGRA